MMLCSTGSRIQRILTGALFDRCYWNNSFTNNEHAAYSLDAPAFLPAGSVVKMQSGTPDLSLFLRNEGW